MLYFTDGSIDSLLDVNENILPPQRVGNLLTRHQLALVFDEKHQQLQGNAFQSHRAPAAEELKAAKV
jgi:hypothetical protein